MKRRPIVNVIVLMLVGFFICSSKSLALFMEVDVNAGIQLVTLPEKRDLATGWGGDYIAEVTYNNPVPNLYDQGYGKASLNVEGIELKSKSYAPNTQARSHVKISDRFTVATQSGTPGAVLDAITNFELTGNIRLYTAQNSETRVWVDLTARQGSILGPVLEHKQIRYSVSWDAFSGQYAGSNSGSFVVSPTVLGLTYNFDLALGLDLTGMLADDPVFLDLVLFTSADHALT